ncbi:MAG TPA: N-acetylmuramoyl-L-alanine amidase [Terriglobales bacterium]|nr:N-acetylmuramoyl-L-alanine amidase [Terriglobales bacterium]
MSANPHNASLGLPDDALPDNGAPENDPPVNNLSNHKLPDGGLPESESIAGSATGFTASPSFDHAPGREALQALLAFSSLHEQLRQRRALERNGQPLDADVWQLEQFVLDEVLQLVAERALTLTGADGVAIAMAEGGAIVCRAAAGTIVPERGARLDPKSGFSGACLRTGGIVRCDDSEKDPRVNVQVCRLLGTRSIVAVPIASAHGTIGLLEAFSSEPHGFNDSDVRSLNLLAELILSALKPEEENRLAELSQRLVNDESVEAPSRGVQNQEGPAPMPTAGEAVAAADTGPEMFREYAKKKKSTFSLAIVLLLLALALVLGAGVWWMFRHSASAKPPAPAPVAAVPANLAKPPEPAPPVPVAEDEAPSSPDDKPSGRTLVTAIWHVSSNDSSDHSSSVIIEMQGPVQYEAHRLSSPERIYLDLHDTRLAPGMFGKTIEIGDAHLARVRIAQPTKGVSRVVLETTGASDFSISLQSNPYRLVVEIRKPGQTPHDGALADLPKSTAVVAQPALPSVPTPQAGKKLSGQARTRTPKFRLVLDAGHGGWDLGTVGRKGLMEKDLVLDVVRRLGKLVEDRLGAEVIYTRRDDTYLPLEKRTEIANLAQADLFVSVHANYSDDSAARGSETYYTNTYSSVRARTPGADAEGAAAENVNWTNVDIRDKVQKSRRFAVAVQQALYGVLASQIPDMRNRGVKKATYVVLTGTSMPAILAEVSFVSSPEDEAKLKSSSYRDKIAEGLFRGIAQYTSTSRGVNVASASSKHSGL